MGLIKLGQKLGERLKENQAKAKIERAQEVAQREILKEKLKQARFTEQIKQAEILGKARAKAQFRPKIQATQPRRQVSQTAFEDVIFGRKPQPQQQKSVKGLSKKEKKKFKKLLKKQGLTSPQRQVQTPSPRQSKPNLDAISFAGGVD